MSSMSQLLVFLLALCATALGCEKARPTSSTECRSDIAELAEWLSELAKEGYHNRYTSAGVQLHRAPAATGTVPLPHMMAFIEIHVGGFSVQGRVGSQAALEALWKEVGHREVVLGVAIARDAPWAQVRRVLSQLGRVGWTSVLLLVEGAPKQTRPAASELEQQMRKVDSDRAGLSPQEQLSTLGPDFLADTYGKCRGAADVARQSRDQRNLDVLVQRLPGALESCNCEVDMKSVRWLHWVFANRTTTPYVVGVPATLEASRGGREPDAATVWAEIASALLVDDTRPVVVLH